MHHTTIDGKNSAPKAATDEGRYAMFRLLGIVFIVLIIIGSLSAYSYSRLETRVVSVNSVAPAFRLDFGSVVGGVFSAFTGNLVGAVASLIDGADVEITVSIANQGVVPLYIPSMTHTVYFSSGPNSQGSQFETGSMWLMPGEQAQFRQSVLIPIEAIPSIAINALVAGGRIDVGVSSTLTIGGLSITRSGVNAQNVTQPVQSRVTQTGARVAPSQPDPTPVRPTATPTPRPTPTPTARTTLLSATPTPTATPRAGPSTRVIVDQMTIHDDHDPLGAGEVYVIMGVEDGSTVSWNRHPSTGGHISVGSGNTVALSNAASNSVPAATRFTVYIGVWEADGDLCYQNWAASVQEPFLGSAGSFASAVERLEQCGDDLVGAGTGTWRQAELADLPPIEMQLGDATVVFRVQVLP